MSKKYLVLLFALFLFLGLWFFVTSTSDTQASENKNLPEEEGMYDVPGHPKLKLRVFVYHPGKPDFVGKPKPTPTPPVLSCGLSDPNSTEIDGLTGWHLSNTHEYRLNKTSVPSTVGSENFSTIAANSFNAWAVTDVGKNVSFTEGSATGISRATYDGQNIITWGRTSSSALAVNYTWYDQSTGIAVENDTIFNAKVPWTWSGGSNSCAYTGFYDAQNILTHELGHRMGLNDEYDSSFSDNTMFGYGAMQEVKKNTLTTGDISAVNSLYP